MNFIPEIVSSLKNYNRQKFAKDLVAGLVVGVVAIPLCIAFAIASGVSPQAGLITGVVGGFFISLLGGSRVQIGGPTGAFIVIVYGIVQQYGVDGLIFSTFLAGVLLIVMGLLRMGSVIKFIPHPLIVGFTSGIAVIIFSSQIKDFLGLHMGNVPADFLLKWREYFYHFNSVNVWSVLIAGFSVLTMMVMPKFSHRIPGSLVAIVFTTLVVNLTGIEVETIGSRFGQLASSIPWPHAPDLDFEKIQKLIQPAFTIALLGGIESLLSAVVADGMIGRTHRSNVELIGQGAANIFSSIFGGIPATGAIARTATNVKSGGRTPVAGIIHAFTLLLVMLVAGKWATMIPLSCLAGILVVVAYNMSEWRSFIAVLKTSKSDGAVLIATFILTVFVDLTVAIEIGLILAILLFMRRMSQISKVNIITDEINDETDDKSISRYSVPMGVEVFEVSGPMFFGAAYKFKEAIKLLEKPPKILIIRMRHVPVIDETGLHTVKEVFKQAKSNGTRLILSGVQDSLYKELDKSEIINMVGNANVCSDIDHALERAQTVLKEIGN